MKILITGASGFIGSFLVEAALGKGWEVWAGVRASSNKKYLLQPELHFIDLDYSNTQTLVSQLKAHAVEFGRWDYIIHNAGVTKCTDTSEFYEVNYQYTTRLLDAIRISDLYPSKFLFMSSLGAAGPVVGSTTRRMTLKDTPKPISEYGKSKWMAERYVQDQKDLPWIVLRPTGVYGPREQDYLVMMKMIQSGLNVSVGLKPQHLDFIHVKDLAEVCMLSLESAMKHKTWFVSDGDVYTSTEFAKLLQEVLHKKKVLSIVVPLFVTKCIAKISEKIAKTTGRASLLNYDKYLVMKQRNWTCDATELFHDLKFDVTYNLRSGLEETVAWYKKNGWL